MQTFRAPRLVEDVVDLVPVLELTLDHSHFTRLAELPTDFVNA
jgi:hypothetical protein